MNSSISCLQDIEDIAVQKLTKNALGYYRSGSDGMQTLHDNIIALPINHEKFKILPTFIFYKTFDS